MPPFPFTLRIVLAAGAVILQSTRPTRLFASAFVVVSKTITSSNTVFFRQGTVPAMSGSESPTTRLKENLLSVSLEKPMGMILEEVEEGKAMGVYVKELAEGGTAITSPWKDELVGLPIASVMGKNVMTLDFDAVMEELIAAPSPVELEFIVVDDASTTGPGGDGQEFSVGTVVTIKVLEDNGKKETVIQAKVGDNLRQTLFDNNVEVYRGLKAKLGNCNGGGQCTFCRADFVETEGWAPRSDYEDKKLKNAPYARLTCLNSIQGPATIRM